MSHQITFDLIHQYDPGRPGILVPISLSLGAQSLITEAHLDTGAANCFFRRSLGEKLGLNIESGHNRNLLGRHGWMQRWRVGLIDYEGSLYLSRYGNGQS